MSAIEIERHHSRGLDAAREEAESLAKDLGDKFGLSYRWEGDVLKFKGSGAKGKMVCANDLITLRLELSFVLRPFRTRIEQEIHKYFDEFCG